MKIVSYMHPLRLWILSDGSSISVDAYSDFRVGMEIEERDGKYYPAVAAEACEV